MCHEFPPAGGFAFLRTSTISASALCPADRATKRTLASACPRFSSNRSGRAANFSVRELAYPHKAAHTRTPSTNVLRRRKKEARPVKTESSLTALLANHVALASRHPA